MKPKKTRLTKPQETLLRAIAAEPGKTGWSEYPPLVKLVALGFVRTEHGMFQMKSFVTDAGREWLEANTK